MNNGLVFILHGPSRAGFAADLASALSPLAAMPMLISANLNTSYGSGATCVVVLDRDLVEHPLSVVSSVPIAGAILYREAGIAVPTQLALYSSVDAQATFEATISVVADAIVRRQSQAIDRAARTRHAAPSLAKRGSDVRETGKHSMVVRSAWGLAATIAVASIAAPAISGRAGATGVSPVPDQMGRVSETNLQAATILTETQIAEQQEPAPVQSPHLIELLDHYDRGTFVESTTVVAYAPEVVAAIELPAASPAALTPVVLSADANVTHAVAAGAPKQASAPMLVVDAMQAQQQPSSVTLKPST